jgi:hypothetical protein
MCTHTQYITTCKASDSLVTGLELSSLGKLTLSSPLPVTFNAEGCIGPTDGELIGVINM